MTFVYLLALIGFLASVALAVMALAEPVEPTEPEDNPYDAALLATARIQSGAWTAIQELRQLERTESPNE